MKECRKKKGQIAGQVFIYIMAAIIIGVIVLVGYNAINSIIQKTCDAERITFETDMKGFIEKYNSYGSVNVKTLKAPCDYDTICFVSNEDILNAPPMGFTCQESAIIKNSVERHVSQNIFALSGKETIPLGYSELISLDAEHATKCLCIKSRNGNFDIRFSGRGATTEIGTK